MRIRTKEKSSCPHLELERKMTIKARIVEKLKQKGFRFPLPPITKTERKLFGTRSL